MASIKQIRTIWLEKTKISDEGLKEFKRVATPLILHLGQTSISDPGVKYLSDTPVFILDLTDDNITDLAIPEFVKIRDLTGLMLIRSKITDKELKHFAKIKTLKNLNLNYTKITDKGIADLSELRQLSTLLVAGTKISKTGAQKLSRALPHCFVDW